MEKILLKNNLKECQSGYDMLELYNATAKDEIESIGSDHDEDDQVEMNNSNVNASNGDNQGNLTIDPNNLSTPLNNNQLGQTGHMLNVANINQNNIQGAGRIILNNFSAASLIASGPGGQTRVALNNPGSLATANQLFRQQQMQTPLTLSRIGGRVDDNDDLLDDSMDDDLNLHAGPGGVFSSTGRYQLEKEKRIRREIANSNERRRMQSINAGFNTLRNLIPTRHKEKMSKASILQQTADYIRFLEEEKNILIKRNNQLEAFIKLNSNLGGGNNNANNNSNAGNNTSPGNNSNINMAVAAQLLQNQQTNTPGMGQLKVVNNPGGLTQLMKSPVATNNIPNQNNLISPTGMGAGTLKIMVSGNTASLINNNNINNHNLISINNNNQQQHLNAANLIAQQLNAAKKRKLEAAGLNIKEELVEDNDEGIYMGSSQDVKINQHQLNSLISSSTQNNVNYNINNNNALKISSFMNTSNVNNNNNANSQASLAAAATKQSNLNALGPVLKNFAPVLPEAQQSNDDKTKLDNNQNEQLKASISVKNVSQVLSLFKAGNNNVNNINNSVNAANQLSPTQLSSGNNSPGGVKIISNKTGTNINFQKLGILKSGNNLLVPKLQLFGNNALLNNGTADEGRRNLQTIVEAIKHLEGDTLFSNPNSNNSNGAGGVPTLAHQNSSSSTGSSSNNESLVHSPLEAAAANATTNVANPLGNNNNQTLMIVNNNNSVGMQQASLSTTAAKNISNSLAQTLASIETTHDGGLSLSLLVNSSDSANNLDLESLVHNALIDEGHRAVAIHGSNPAGLGAVGLHHQVVDVNSMMHVNPPLQPTRAPMHHVLNTQQAGDIQMLGTDDAAASAADAMMNKTPTSVNKHVGALQNNVDATSNNQVLVEGRTDANAFIYP